MPDSSSRLEQLRQYRGHGRERDVSIHSTVRAAAANAARTHKRLGRLIELWETLLPADLVGRTTITSFKGGTVHVAVDSAATAYELDRLLREGLQRRLIEQYPGTLLRIKIKQDAV